MKISAVLLFVAFLHVSAKTLAQKVSLSVKNAPIATVFEQISDQTGYDFAFSTSAIRGAKPVTIDVKNVELADVLKEIFNDQPLDYSIEEKSVIVSVKQVTTSPNKSQTSLAPDKIEVKGKVVDDKGLALSGATVAIKGSNAVTLTDTKGTFDLQKVDPNATIVISYIGYAKTELPAAADMGIIKLKPAENPLDEVKVIAYGETTDRLNVGDVSTVTAKVIEQQPVTSVLQALEDRVPGLLITSGGGLPGAAPTVNIRGLQSIANGTQPFFVIDGVPFTSQDIYATSSGGSDPLSFINPTDIESVSVLKDADATSIYGSRAANGAILITTKKGKAGKTRLDINYRQGVEFAPQDIKWMNTQQYLQMRREAIANDGLVPDTTYASGTAYAPDIIKFDPNRYTNWEKFLTGNAAQYKDIGLSVSGGNANTQFLISGNYHEQSTVFPFAESVPQGGLHFNITNTSLDNRFKLSVTGGYSVNTSHLPQKDISQYSDLAPNLPSLYNKDGSLDLVASDLGGFQNPLSFMLQQANESTNNLIGNATLSYEFIKNLKFTVSLGYNQSQSNDNTVTPIASLDPSYSETGFATFNTTNTSSWIAEPRLNYLLQGEWGKLDVLAGATFEENTMSAQVISASNYSSDALIDDIAAAPTLQAFGVQNSEYKYNALFSRVNYSYQDSYILDLTWRRDGSSRFGADNALHGFGSVGGAWIFSKEKLIVDDLSWLSFGKLRVSYGTTGNDQIGDYRYDNLYQLVGGNYYQGAIGLVPTGLPNASLEWEETRKLEGGVELGFLKDRILVTASYYRDRSSNQLLSEPLSSITGFNSVTINLPATVQNTGWELTLKTDNIQTGNFSWKTNVNFSANQNKLLSFPGLATSPYYAGLYVIGKPLGSTMVFHYLDVNPQTGLYEFLGANGQPTSNPSTQTDRTAVSPSTVPKFFGGFGNDINYRGLQLSFFFQFRKQTGFNTLLLGNGYPFGQGPINAPTAGLEVWQKPGDIAPFEKYTSEGGTPASIAYVAAIGSTYKYVDASYIRLGNLSLSYQFKGEWLNRLKLQNIKVFMQAQNLLTITDYKGGDPETQNLQGLPPLRVFVAGLSVSL